MLKKLALVALCTWAAGLGSIFHDVAAGRGFVLGQHFLAFEDILNYRDRFRLYHRASFYSANARLPHFHGSPPAFAYPPLDAPLYALFYAFHQPEYVFLALLSVWLLVIWLGAGRALSMVISPTTQVFAVLGYLATSAYPVVFLADRANVEVIVLILITLAVLLYANRHSYAAAALLGLAAALKLYPVLLLGLFFSRRRSRALVFALLTGFAATLAALWYSGPTVSLAWQGFLDGVLRFKHQQGETTHHLAAMFDHSLFSPWKLPGMTSNPEQLAGAYYLIAAILAAGLFFVRAGRLPFLNRFVFLSISMIVLPPVSYEYTLVHLYLPLLLLLLFLAGSPSGYPEHRTASATFVLLFLVMLPMSLIGDGGFLYAGVVKLAILLSVAGLSLVHPWPLEVDRFGFGANPSFLDPSPVR